MRVYLASPYSHRFAVVRWWRFLVVAVVVARLMSLGVHVYSPILHCHLPAFFGRLPKGWDYWAKIDKAEIERSDVFAVLKLNGWNLSTGIGHEEGIARKWSKPILALKFGEEGKFAKRLEALAAEWEAVDRMSLSELTAALEAARHA